MKLKIATKMFLAIVVSAVIIYSIAIAYIGISGRNRSYSDTNKSIDAEVHESAALMKALFDYEMSVVKTLAYAFPGLTDSTFHYRNKIYNDLYLGVFNNNPQFYAIWDSWEKSFTDSGYTMPYGRWVNQHIRTDSNITHETIEKSIDGDLPDYARIKSLKNRDWFEEPYVDGVLMTSLIASIIVDDEFVGAIGADISLDRFKELVNDIEKYEGSYSILISNSGKYVSCENPDHIGKSVIEATPYLDVDGNLLENIKRGVSFSYNLNDTDFRKYYISFAPVSVGKTETPWSLALAVPVDVIMEEANSRFGFTILIGVIGLIILTLITWFVSKNISNPLVRSATVLKSLALGNIDKKQILNNYSDDETGEIAKSVNTLIVGLNKTVEFADQIGKGNFESEFNRLSDNDTLGNSLIKMRDSLVAAEEEMKRRETEDEKQRWATSGLAKFADILRNNSTDITELSYDIISSLVKYLNANQGGLFVINDNDQDNVFIEMMACFAYDRKKHLEKQIEIGVSLIGRCAQEGETIYMTDIPDEYIEIKSGLGTANPNSLIIVPLKVNDEIFGVIEIASFSEFEDYQREFIEKVGENIASALSNVRINVRTALLLKQSKEQTEKLAQQEEEMRQNMEEMVATQEETMRTQQELEDSNTQLSEDLERLQQELDQLKGES